jgi:hypothetical protein|tara:strand:+ start:38 stop:370 length:333 start_codon:yes stop_codon:yes gene_type:complete
MKKAKFSCATSEVFNGFKTDLTWNGWECPLFELDEAKRVIEHFNYQQKTFGGEYYEQFTYIESEDAILSQTFEEGLHMSEHDWKDKPTIIDGVKYYEVANCNYTWELAQD